jgi:hypothetical protein
MEKTEKTTGRLFTPEEANKTLPYVERVIKDIVDTHQRISDLYSTWRAMSDEDVLASTDESERKEAEKIEGQIRVLLGAREEFVEELETIGCEFKDFQLGLVDFPARLGDRDVYLCWRMGEPEIQFWHELHDGVSGRQPISEHFH